MTSYKDLTTHGKFLIDLRFSQELRSWKKCSIWWRKLESDVHREMLAWFNGFIEFRRAVLDGGDLIACMQKWVKCNEPIDSLEFIKKRNVPQLGFCLAINQALRELEAYRACN